MSAARSRPLRVTLDATPLLGVRTGVGRYVEGLLAGLSALPEPPALTLTAFTVRGASGLRDAAPPGARVVHRPAPARGLQWLWARGPLPPAELLSGRADVLHATNFVLPPSRAAGVVTVHDLAYEHHGDTVTAASLRYRALVPRALARAAAVLCPSQATADDLQERYAVPAGRVRVTPLGVDAAWATAGPLTPQERAGLGLPERYLLFVGAREPRKDLPVLLAAHAAARAQDADLPDLVLTGPAGWGAVATGSARVTGFLPGPALRSVVAGATALVLPSRYEGFGLPVLEALACGTPVVASDIPAHREVAGGHAALFPVGDVDALGQALLDASRAGPDPAARAARRARAAGFTWHRCAALTAAAYADAAS